MVTSMISTETVYLTGLNCELMFSQMEFRRDQSSIVVKVDVSNTGTAEEVISNHHFTLSSELQCQPPSVSYISDDKTFGENWSRKIMAPGQSCTIIFKFNLSTNCSWYDLNYNYRNNKTFIKRFQ